MDASSLIPTNLGTWAGLTAAAALIGGFWRQGIALVGRLCDLVIGRVAFRDDASKAVMSYVWKHGTRSPLGLRVFGGTTSYVFPKRRVEVVGFEGVTSEPLLFWFGRVPLLISQGYPYSTGTSEQPNVGGDNRSDAIHVTIRFMRFTFNADTFVKAAIKHYNDLRQVTKESEGATKKMMRFNVIRMLGQSGKEKGDAGGPSKAKTMDEAISENTLKRFQCGELRLLDWKPEDLVERSNDAAPFSSHPIDPALLREFDEIDTWLKHENWFRSKGVPWRRGYLLYGEPGTGKDTIIRNLAMRHDLPVYAFDLSTYDNQSFARDWKTVMQNAPAIALMSDLDTVFNGRTNVAVKDKTRDGLTFDCLLNTVSGVGSSDGVLLFVTTNNVATLDPALGVPDGTGRSTRPGRIDKALCVGRMAEPERQRLASHILEDWPDEQAAIVAAGGDETAAQFQERCAQVAMARFWERGVKGSYERVEHKISQPIETQWIVPSLGTR